MTLYNNLLKIAEIIKQKDEVKELINIYNEVKVLKKDMQYYEFFSLCEGKVAYCFSAPDISFQIIQNCLNKKDFEIIPENRCKQILSNQLIKKFVEESQKVNDLVMNEITSLFNVSTIKKNSFENYIYNKTVEELEYIGFIEMIKNMIGMNEQIKKYLEERNKIYDPNVTVLPINKFNKEYIKKMNDKNIDNTTIDIYEKHNMIFCLILRIIYNYVYDSVYNLDLKDVKNVNIKNKNYIKFLTFDIEITPYIQGEGFPIFCIDEELYFVYGITYEFRDNVEKTTYKCFSCKLDESNSLLKMSIFECDSLFEE